MRARFVFLALSLLISSHVQAAEPESAKCPEVLNVRLHNLNNEPVDLCVYTGQVVPVVNTASHCGFTPQYKALEALYRNYDERGVTVLGFPSNDFGNRESGSNKELEKFCKLTYGVGFLMLEKACEIKPDSPEFIGALEAMLKEN